MTPTLSPEQYAQARAIVDRAAAYWKAHATFDRSGWSSMSAELAAHPDYAACSNEIRGQVEQFELLRDMPEKFTAYIGQPARNGMGCDRIVGQTYPVTVWTGERLGNATRGAFIRSNQYGERMYQFYARINGRDYTGRSYGPGMYISLRETADSKRNRQERPQ